MYIIFDIGGTNTRVAASEDLQTYGEPIKFKTPLPYSEGFEALAQAIETLSAGKKILGIAGGIRGPLNKDKTGIISESILIDWVNRSITTDFTDRFSAPAYLENDSAIVGLGEATHGAGVGYGIVAYLTVSTGVGGARYVDGKLDVTSVGFEPGHQIMDLSRSIFGKDIPHTLENLVSGNSLERRFGKKPYEIPQSDAVWDELAGYIAIGLRNTILYWSPHAIVLGGSMVVGDPRILREDVIKHTEEALDGFVPCPPILDATLADEGGLYGAMALLSQNIEKIK
jgi:predicted NBD/HSP70 family sugar kinase